MSWQRFAIFSQNFSKMLEHGVSFDKALETASKVLGTELSSKVIYGFRRVFIDGASPAAEFLKFKLPPLYINLMEYAQKNGNHAASLSAAAEYLFQLADANKTLGLFRLLAAWALSIGIAAKIIFLGKADVVMIIFIAVLIVPFYFRQIRFYFDLILSKMPFVGTFLTELCLLELFATFKVVYSCSMPVTEMFETSVNAVSNLYLKDKSKKAVISAQNRLFFFESFQSIPYVTNNFTAAIAKGEQTGTLDKCFEAIATHLYKTIDAKLVMIKYLTIVIFINVGVLIPILLILPHFIDRSMHGIFYLTFGSLPILVVYITLKNSLQEYSIKKSLIVPFTY